MVDTCVKDGKGGFARLEREIGPSTDRARERRGETERERDRHEIGAFNLDSCLSPDVRS